MASANPTDDLAALAVATSREGATVKLILASTTASSESATSTASSSIRDTVIELSMAPTGPSSDLAGPVVANNKDDTALESQKALNGGETSLSNSTAMDDPKSAATATAATAKLAPAKKTAGLTTMPLEIREMIYKLAVIPPEHLEVQIDIAKSNDCLAFYGPHECQEKHGKDASLSVITFTTPVPVHPLLRTCKTMRDDIMSMMSKTHHALPTANRTKILFDPENTAIYVNNMGNFLAAYQDLRVVLCCQKSHPFEGIKKMAIDFRCCIKEGAWYDHPYYRSGSRPDSDASDSDDSDDYCWDDDWDWSAGPKEGIWGKLFEHGFRDLEALQYVLFSRDGYDVNEPGEMNDFEREIAKAILKREVADITAMGEAYDWPESRKNVGCTYRPEEDDKDDFWGYDPDEEYDEPDPDDIPEEFEKDGHDLDISYHDASGLGCLRTAHPMPVREWVQAGAPSSYFGPF